MVNVEACPAIRMSFSPQIRSSSVCGAPSASIEQMSERSCACHFPTVSLSTRETEKSRYENSQLPVGSLGADTDCQEEMGEGFLDTCPFLKMPLDNVLLRFCVNQQRAWVLGNVSLGKFIVEQASRCTYTNLKVEALLSAWPLLPIRTVGEYVICAAELATWCRLFCTKLFVYK